MEQHPRANILYDPSHFVLQQLDYLAFIDIYHERIKAFHVKDAEFRPNGGRACMAATRAGSIARAVSARWATARSISARSSRRWRSTTIAGWAVLEWECALKHPEDGAREGADFIRHHIIRVAERAFDDFAGSGVDAAQSSACRLTGDRRP